MITRFSFGNKYPTKRLGELVHFLDNMRRPVTEADRKPGPYPYYGANGQQGVINSYLFDEPLVLLAEDGGHFDSPERGIAYRIAGKTWVNNHAHVLRPTPLVDIDYLCRVLENYDVRPWVTGTTRGKLTKAGASDIEIPLPPLPEQRRIAAILDKADALRAKRREAIAKLDQLLQSVFLDMFGDPVTNPKVDVVPLASICTRITDGTHQSPKWSDEGVPFLFQSNVKPGEIVFDTKRHISLADQQALTARCPIEYGDVLYTIVGSYGNAAMVRTRAPFCFQRHIAHLKPTKSLLPEFLEVMLNQAAVKQQADERATGIAQKTLILKELREIRVLKPSMELQKLFRQRSGSLAIARTFGVLHQAAIDELFASLQQQAFAGQL
jgi:type I restriction enzyme S subunit